MISIIVNGHNHSRSHHRNRASICHVQIRPGSPVRYTHIVSLRWLYFQGRGIAGCEPAVATAGPQDAIGHVELYDCIGPIT